MKSIREVIKEEYVGKTFEVDENNRTEVVRLFMDALREVDSDDYLKARAIRHFLGRFSLSNAEIHAILFKKGFRYAPKKGKYGSYCIGVASLRNIKIDAYHDHQTKTTKQVLCPVCQRSGSLQHFRHYLRVAHGEKHGFSKPIKHHISKRKFPKFYENHSTMHNESR